MNAPLPVPIDVLELVLSLLRPLLADRPEPVLKDVRVASETGHGTEGGPPSLPWLRLTEDGHTWTWPAIQRVVIRLTCWHRTEHDAKAAVGLALAVLCNLRGVRGLISADPITGPIAAPDPHTTRPLATATVAVHVRTPARP
ncbi:hypothetical protein FKR81_32495 [Lentzea tibetensis]|uniref:DUF3168 domain-containing protein n=1 Tax=Lentzea tibetensis TaxID=2591470 RepID=A0A563EK60_9PSEU|nr:hypothetical protein [Lentzea tibetensis]TWP47434.1 hypothetical protein FKR81_32495 [Lentzea tibetensis]